MSCTGPAEPAWAAGADGCPGGWLVVARHTESGAVRRCLCARFEDVLELEETAAVLAVDMPIGFPERVLRGGRACDVEARSRLGPRQSSVFAVPSRAAVAEADYGRACAVNLAHSDPPRRVSRQCFHLFAKMREVDALMTPALQERVFEVHPELAFWALNGCRPVEEPKKVKSVPHAPGLALRRRLLEKAGFPAAALAPGEWPRRLVGADDIIDAAALAWSAARLLAGTAVTLPADPPRDRRGLRMEIRA